MLGLFHRLPMFPKTEKYHYCWGDPFDPYASGPEIPAEGVVAPELVKTDRKDLRGETQPTKISLGGRNNHYKYVWVISISIYIYMYTGKLKGKKQIEFQKPLQHWVAPRHAGALDTQNSFEFSQVLMKLTSVSTYSSRWDPSKCSSLKFLFQTKKQHPYIVMIFDLSPDLWPFWPPVAFFGPALWSHSCGPVVTVTCFRSCPGGAWSGGSVSQDRWYQPNTSEESMC